MEDQKDEKSPVNTGTGNRLATYFRMIFGIVFVLGLLFLIYKMAMNRFG